MKSIIKKILLFVFATILGPFSLCAADVSVNADIDTVVIMIGRQIRLHLSSIQPKDVRVQFPLFSETISDGVEIVRREKHDTTIVSKNRIEVKQDYVITAFDSGVYYMPPFHFVLDNGDTLMTNSLTIKAITFPVDTVNKFLCDVKPVLVPPFDWLRLFLNIGLGILIVLVLAVATLFIIYFVRNRSALFVATDEDKLPPHVVALQGLDKIKTEKLWQQGREKQFYSDLTDVLRVYIEDRFSVNALEMTSDEIVEHLKELPEASVVLRGLEQVLKSADLVKFAKAVLTSSEDEMNINYSYSFVEETKKKEEKIEIADEESLVDDSADNKPETSELQPSESGKAPIDYVFEFADKFVGYFIRLFRKKQ
jgi:hypothetical protein